MLNLALMGMSPRRDDAREVGRIVRELYAHTETSLGRDVADELVLPTLEGVRQRITDVFGTSGWEDPGVAASATAAILAPAPGRRTDEELVSLAYEEDVEGLMQEIRHLRSDAWLKRAAEEFLREMVVSHAIDLRRSVALLVGTLKRHRDGNR